MSKDQDVEQPEIPISKEEKEWKHEFERRLDEIAEKYKGELTPEQKKQRELEMHKLAADSMKEFNRVWSTLTRSHKRKLIKKEKRYSSRLKTRLK
jgi:hypothetical protein